MTAGAPARPFASRLAFTTRTPTPRGVVYYANYLKFMERARTEWLAALGFELARRSKPRTASRSSSIAPEIEYQPPARLGDRLDATLELIELGRARMVALQQVWRGASAC